MKGNLSEKIPRMTVNDLAIIVCKSLDALEKTLKDEFKREIDRLDGKIDYRFNALSNRMDDLSLNRATWEEHNALRQRVLHVENKLGLAN